MTPDPLRLALPKGRIQRGVFDLLAEAGMPVVLPERQYRPRIALDSAEAKILKPQSVVAMLHAGSRDLGFAGADWVRELGADLVEVLDTGMDPVRIVAAAPTASLEDGTLPRRSLVVASEYETITRQWIEEKGLDARFLRSWGATEVYPPDDADCIVDNTATGSTLAANGLEIIDELMRSSTRLYANPSALENPEKAAAIERFVLLLRGVLDARKRVMLELNVGADNLEAVVAELPSMREPTVSPLHHGAGFAVRAAVPRDTLRTLIPSLKDKGGTDIVVTEIAQIVS